MFKLFHGVLAFTDRCFHPRFYQNGECSLTLSQVTGQRSSFRFLVKCPVETSQRQKRRNDYSIGLSGDSWSWRVYPYLYPEVLYYRYFKHAKNRPCSMNFVVPMLCYILSRIPVTTHDFWLVEGGINRKNKFPFKLSLVSTINTILPLARSFKPPHSVFGLIPGLFGIYTKVFRQECPQQVLPDSHCLLSYSQLLCFFLSSVPTSFVDLSPMSP